MSRIGKKPVEVPSGVNVKSAGSDIEVSGPLGKLSWTVPDGISVVVDAGGKGPLQVSRASDVKHHRALHGLSRSLIANMVEGVSKGFERRLEIYGTGYSCNVKGKTLELNVGFMGRGNKEKAQFSVPIPDGLEVVAEVPAARGDTDPAKLLVKGCDKQVVGQFSAQVRKIRPPEPYKGKGIRYAGEHVRRKQGKAMAGAGGR
jgi:large subunit ribosomal protein L6